MDLGIGRVGDVDDLAVKPDEKAGAASQVPVTPLYAISINNFPGKVGQQLKVQITLSLHHGHRRVWRFPVRNSTSPPSMPLCPLRSSHNECSCFQIVFTESGARSGAAWLTHVKIST